MKSLIVIAGPTCSGKTDLAIAIAKHYGTEIISADSRQCYKEMNIGVARPTVQQLVQIKHHFVASHTVHEHITAGAYERLALQYLTQIFTNHNTAVLCGGTGLYIKALCEGIDEMPSTNDDIADGANQKYQERGLLWLQREVQSVDPDFYETAETDNPRRLLRALIFKQSTGESILNYRSAKPKQRDFATTYHIIDLPRQTLYDNINERVLGMFAQGQLEEARSLQHLEGNKNLDTVGYTECFAHLQGEHSIEKTVELVQQHTRQYAKRQVTWFKKMYPNCFDTTQNILDKTLQ